MITAIDANVLIDLGVEGSERAGRAARILETSAAAGPVVLCDVVLAEFARGFPEKKDPVVWLRGLGLGYDPIREEAAVAAGRMHARYEERTGRRAARPIADFLIGAHALVQANRLLTSDRGFYRDYFRGLKLVEPR